MSVLRALAGSHNFGFFMDILRIVLQLSAITPYMLEVGKRDLRTSEINYESVWDERINDFRKSTSITKKMLIKGKEKRMYDWKIMWWHSLYWASC